MKTNSSMKDGLSNDMGAAVLAIFQAKGRNGAAQEAQAREEAFLVAEAKRPGLGTARALLRAAEKPQANGPGLSHSGPARLGGKGSRPILAKPQAPQAPQASPKSLGPMDPALVVPAVVSLVSDSVWARPLPSAGLRSYLCRMGVPCRSTVGGQ